MSIEFYTNGHECVICDHCRREVESCDLTDVHLTHWDDWCIECLSEVYGDTFEELFWLIAELPTPARVKEDA